MMQRLHRPMIISTVGGQTLQLSTQIKSWCNSWRLLTMFFLCSTKNQYIISQLLFRTAVVWRPHICLMFNYFKSSLFIDAAIIIGHQRAVIVSDLHCYSEDLASSSLNCDSVLCFAVISDDVCNIFFWVYPSMFKISKIQHLVISRKMPAFHRAVDHQKSDRKGRPRDISTSIIWQWLLFYYWVRCPNYVLLVENEGLWNIH